MKKTLLLMLLTFLFISFGCNKDDDDKLNSLVANSEWVITHSSGPGPTTYEVLKFTSSEFFVSTQDENQVTVKYTHQGTYKVHNNTAIEGYDTGSKKFIKFTLDDNNEIYCSEISSLKFIRQ